MTLNSSCYTLIRKPVFLTAFRAYGSTVGIECELMPIFGYPSGLAARIANDESIGFDIFCYNGPGTDKCIFTNLIATDNGCIGTY